MSALGAHASPSASSFTFHPFFHSLHLVEVRVPQGPRSPSQHPELASLACTLLPTQPKNYFHSRSERTRAPKTQLLEARQARSRAQSTGDLLCLRQLLLERTDGRFQLMDLVCQPVLDLRGGEGGGAAVNRAQVLLYKGCGFLVPLLAQL